MLPHMVTFLLMGKIPLIPEGIGIYIAEKLLGIANVLCTLLLQLNPPPQPRKAVF